MFDTNTLTADIVGRVQSQAARLSGSLRWPPGLEGPERDQYPGPLHADIDLFVRIANGQIERRQADDELIGLAVERLQALLDALFLPAYGRAAYQVPPAFWREPGIGQVLARVQAWLRRDDLIGLTEAAQLLFPELARDNLQAARMRLRRLVNRGALMSYIAPDEPNPTQQLRVSRQALEALAAAQQTGDE